MTQQIFESDIAVIGGGLGGVAAALAACETGLRVILTEPTDWIGGQVTAQAMSALDEHRFIETFGGTRSYYRFREGVREAYRQEYGMPERLPDGLPLNPGNGWASRLCFEPRVGLQVLNEMLASHIASDRLTILLEQSPVGATVRAGRVTAVQLAGPGRWRTEVRASLFLDATEMGDLLPLASVPYSTGVEPFDQTGEPHAARECPNPSCIQSFTVCFVVEHRPGEDHTIHKPIGYETWRDNQPFTMMMRRQGGQQRRMYMFADHLPFWTFRRLFDQHLVPGGTGKLTRDLALINWDSIDYYKEPIIDRTPAQQARVLSEARRLSLSFLYWLQTEVPRDDGRGNGYPGLKLVPDATGTADGLAKAPHIRESRRITGLRRVVEQELIAQSGRGTRAAHFQDTVGVGWYPFDMHRSSGDPTCGCDQRIEFDPTLPFQIPLGALISPVVENVIAAAKNIALTHITAAAFRAQPVEWNVGEAAGALAAYCLRVRSTPRGVWENPDLLRGFQRCLLERGVPLAWTVDLGLDDSSFVAIQSCMLESPPPQRSPRGERLQVLPDQPLSRSEGAWLLRQVPGAPDNPALTRLLQRWREAPHIPFMDANLRAAFAALDLAEPAVSEYPTLRQVCEQLKQYTG